MDTLSELLRRYTVEVAIGILAAIGTLIALSRWKTLEEIRIKLAVIDSRVAALERAREGHE